MSESSVFDPIVFDPCPRCNFRPDVSIREVSGDPMMADGILGQVGCTTCRCFDHSNMWMGSGVMVFTPLPCGKHAARYKLAELWNLHVAAYTLRARVAKLEAALARKRKRAKQ